MYRPERWNSIKTTIEKQKKRSNWHKIKSYESVLFVSTTLKSELKRKYLNEISRSVFKIRVVELTGISVKRLLKKSNLFEKQFCERSDCLICRSNGKEPIMLIALHMILLAPHVCLKN